MFACTRLKTTDSLSYRLATRQCGRSNLLMRVCRVLSQTPVKCLSVGVDQRQFDVSRSTEMSKASTTTSLRSVTTTNAHATLYQRTHRHALLC